VPNLGSAGGFAATNIAAKLMADDLGGAVLLTGILVSGVGTVLVARTCGVSAIASSRIYGSALALRLLRFRFSALLFTLASS
jgi:hypothetical protein